MGLSHTRMTSQSHPLHIDGIKMLGSWGMLGITFCPGKKDAHSRSGPWDRDLDADLDLIKAWPAAAVVTLIEPHEFELLGVGGLGEAEKITISPSSSAILGWESSPMRAMAARGSPWLPVQSSMIFSRGR